MHGEPVTIRMIDPPLHEFLPKREDLMVEIAKLEARARRARSWPRRRRCCTASSSCTSSTRCSATAACRLGITYPEISDMQARAIFEAAAGEEGRAKVVPEIMIPLVGLVEELQDQKAIVDRVADEVMKEQGVKVKYLVGTMIEVPRGALTADEIAEEAQFFSFGTNDLTQMTFGFSRDDVGQVPGHLPGEEDPERDPFQSIDTVGVGQLVAMGVEKGREDAQRTSSWASAASTAATRRRSTSSTRSASTT